MLRERWRQRHRAKAHFHAQLHVWAHQHTYADTSMRAAPCATTCAHMFERINTHSPRFHVRTCLSFKQAHECASAHNSLEHTIGWKDKTVVGTTYQHDVTWQDRIQHEITWQDRSGQDRTGQDMTGNEMTWRYRIGKDRPSKDMTWNDMTGQDRTGNNITWNIMK